jgi:threonine synthase
VPGKRVPLRPRCSRTLPPFAAGLRVPKPYGDSLILDIVRESGGTVVDLPDEKILASLLDWTRSEGLLLCPEGACATAAYDHLLATGFLKSGGSCGPL